MMSWMFSALEEEGMDFKDEQKMQSGAEVNFCHLKDTQKGSNTTELRLKMSHLQTVCCRRKWKLNLTTKMAMNRGLQWVIFQDDPMLHLTSSWWYIIQTLLQMLLQDYLSKLFYSYFACKNTDDTHVQWIG